jgi:TolB-like protein
MNRDPEQEYFSDGITEDIITNLSKVSGIFVISSKSSFLYRGAKTEIQKVAKELGVRYVLEGSIRRSGDRIRITAKLIDAKTEHYVWADSYDRELKDIFSVQDDVTQKVVSELAVTLTATESERRVRKYTENFEAYDMYLRARRTWGNVSRESHLKVQGLSQRAIELDPNFAGGYGLLSFSLSRAVRFGFSNSPREDLEKAYELAQKAISVDDTFVEAYLALASILLLKRRHDEALAATIKATMIQPGDSWPNVWVGFYLHWVGRGEEAVEAIKKARLLNPKYKEGRDAAYLSFMGYAGFTAGFYEEAIEAMKQSKARFGFAVPRQAFLIASYIKLGREKEARAAVQELLKRHPKFSLSSWHYGRNYKNPKEVDRLYNALRKAQLSE